MKVPAGMVQGGDMPRAYPKSLQTCAVDVRIAYEKAFANPNATVIVQENATIAEATNLHARLNAVRQGFLLYYPQDHEYYRATAAKRLRIEREYNKDRPTVRTVTLHYSGKLKRPSELVEEYKQLYLAGKRELPY